LSKAPAEKQAKPQVVSLDTILAKINELREYINILQTQVNSLTQELTELQLALSSMKSLQEISKDTDILITLDRLGAVLVPGKIDPSWKDRILVNIGKNYYAKVGPEIAEKILSRRIGSIQNILRLRQQELSNAVNEYNYLQQLVATAIYQQQRLQTRQASGEQQ